MKRIIGFATQFYTLWDYEAVPQYKTDSYGNHHQTGIDHKYYYIKNISTDVEKVKATFPNVVIDTELRGTSSFTRNEKIDLPEGYFWGGKYTGKLIDEIMESDFHYCLWSADNYGGKTSNYIRNHPKYKAHFEAIEKAKQDIINSSVLLKTGDTVELEFKKNGYNAYWSDNGKIDYIHSTENDMEIHGADRCYSLAMYGELEVVVICSGVKQVNGMYPYLMPVINGKAQKTKGKKITVNVIGVMENHVIGDNVTQFVKIA